MRAGVRRAIRRKITVLERAGRDASHLHARLEPEDVSTDQGVSLDQNIPDVLTAVGSDIALAQSVMEDEASRDRPRTSLLEALAGIVAGEEE